MFPSTAFSVGKNVAKACGGCHFTKSAKKDHPGIPIPKSQKESVHKNFNCIECHEYHPETKVPKGREAHPRFKNVECGKCHVAIGKFAANDVHTKAWKEKKLKKSPCVACHGYHDIKPPANPASVVNKNNLKKLCNSCHKTESVPKRYHKKYLYSKEGCVTCHSENHRDLSKYHMDMKELEKSIHHIQECIDCHDDIKSIPHEPKLKQVNCVKCHSQYMFRKSDGSSPTKFKKGIHSMAKISKKNRKAPRCVDCHDLYDLSDPRSKVSSINVVKTCLECHRAMESGGQKKPNEKMNQYYSAEHKKLFKKNPELEKSICTDCHGEHNAPERKKVSLIKVANRSMEPVPFNHTLHEKAITPCSTCHHKLLKACGKCHTQNGSAAGASITGYQAYHWPDVSHSCVGCHDEQKKKIECAGCHDTISRGSMESSCNICHTGDTGYADGSKRHEDPFTLLPKGIPDVINITVVKEKYGAVKFPHKHVIEALAKSLGNSRLANTFHAGRPVVCIACHHHSPLGKKPTPCATCHREQTDRRNINKPGLNGALHRNCLGCHKSLKVDDYIYCGSCHVERNPGIPPPKITKHKSIMSNGPQKNPAKAKKSKPAKQR